MQSEITLRQTAQQALEVLTLLQGDIEWTSNSPTLKFVNNTITALKQALAEPECKCTMRQKMVGDGCAVCNPERAKDLAEPQTTHWEGCEAVHPECKTEQTVATWENKYGMKEWQVHAIRAGWMPAPIPRKPLTDEEIWNTYKNLWMFHPAEEPRLAGDVLKFARAIERAHGITGEQHE